MDPDCCSSPECTDNMYCRASPDPAEILLRKQPPSTTASFYEKMRFLVEENSVQMETSKNAFNERYVDRVKRIWYLSPKRAAEVLARLRKVQASLRIRAVSPEPPLLAHTSSESRGTFRQKASSLASLNG